MMVKCRPFNCHHKIGIGVYFKNWRRGWLIPLPAWVARIWAAYDHRHQGSFWQEWRRRGRPQWWLE